ncbi:cytochrome c oxidase subunit 4 [Corynebacterium caspium]|uniref:aa3-type cytochrome oxidase subunit IV n=1 Tax=Corynebacterium caspium TaxID=234828 RepID=UPI000376EF61|nr:cytochrome c oxidase subunit 4 [Corynebacterium caspium]WKD58967.1 Cytochrome c oxidase polypeptide 4 [Corynebacterium caspium DSM 44850]
MKSGSRVMYGITMFLFIMVIIYTPATIFVKDDAWIYGIEWAGVVALTLATLLALMLAVYLQFTERRSDILPEDWEEAEIADKAGILGFFSPSSIWPVAMSGAILVLGLGIIYMHYWLIVLGAALLVYTTVRLSMQYGLPREKH